MMMRSKQLPTMLMRRHNRLRNSGVMFHHRHRGNLVARVTSLRESHGTARLSSHQWSINALRRWHSAAAQSTTTATTATIASTPPLPIRAALVATTTAIGTPAFPVVGVVNFGLRYVVWDSSSRYAILGATTLAGSIFTLVQFAAFDMLPVVYSYGQLFLPFALVNGSLSGMAYLALDVALGTAKIAGTPWAGAAMGAFVGFMGPVSGLYDHAFQWCYDIPDAEGWFTYLLNNSIMLPICMTTGAAVGLMMHPLMYYPIVGVRTVHWAKFSAPLLAGTTALMTHLYHAEYYNFAAPETYLTSEEKGGMQLVPRFHAKRLEAQDWGPATGYQQLHTGTQARASASRKLEHAKRTPSIDMVFDSKRKAWLHYVTNGLFGEDAALQKIPSEKEMNQAALQYLSSDGAVAFILQQQQQHSQPSTTSSKDSASAMRQGLTELTQNLLESTRRQRDSNKPAQRIVDLIELASCGIALLLESKKQYMRGSTNTTTTTTTTTAYAQKEREWKQMEHNIRKLVPDVMLYVTEERDEQSKGCSVESQLNKFSWYGLQDEKAKNNISREWGSGMTAFLTAEAEATKRQNISLAMVGLSVMLAVGLIGGKQ